MSKWTKEELDNMLEDVVNELELSDSAVEKHGPLGTAPAELVRLVLNEKDLRIRALEANVVDASKSNCNIPHVVGRSGLLKAFMGFAEWYKEEYKQHIPLGAIKEYIKSL